MYISQIFFNILETVHKTAWMVRVTNLLENAVPSPEDFKNYYDIYRWYATGFDDKWPMYVQNFTVSATSAGFGDGAGFELQPMRSIMKVEFAGQRYAPEEVFETSYTLQSSSCLRLKKKFLQRSAGNAGGLQVTMFSGYPGLGQKPLYLDMELTLSKIY